MIFYRYLFIYITALTLIMTIQLTFSYKFQVEFCINGENCSSIKTIPMRCKTRVQVSKPIVCPCNRKFNYLCENKYCTLNKETCDKLNTSSKFFQIKKCGNDNKKFLLN